MKDLGSYNLAVLLEFLGKKKAGLRSPINVRVNKATTLDALCYLAPDHGLCTCHLSGLNSAGRSLNFLGTLFSLAAVGRKGWVDV